MNRLAQLKSNEQLNSKNYKKKKKKKKESRIHEYVQRKYDQLILCKMLNSKKQFQK